MLLRFGVQQNIICLIKITFLVLVLLCSFVLVVLVYRTKLIMWKSFT